MKKRFIKRKFKRRTFKKRRFQKKKFNKSKYDGNYLAKCTDRAEIFNTQAPASGSPGGFCCVNWGTPKTLANTNPARNPYSAVTDSTEFPALTAIF